MTDRTHALDPGSDLGGTPAEVIEAVWADALGVEAVDPDAGFFDLGATSNMMLDVVGVLRRRWPHLKIVDIFSHPTVGRLAAFLGDE